MRCQPEAIYNQRSMSNMLECRCHARGVRHKTIIRESAPKCEITTFENASSRRVLYTFEIPKKKMMVAKLGQMQSTLNDAKLHTIYIAVKTQLLSKPSCSRKKKPKRR